jgi:hypothetical protein
MQSLCGPRGCNDRDAIVNHSRASFASVLIVESESALSSRPAQALIA